MKVILNQDVPNLGELGDVKDVAAGYARNYLLPRGLAFPFSPSAVAMFASRKAEIEARKAEKRKNSLDIKTRLDAEELVLDMPAGPNGKLFGGVSNATVADELTKKGYNVDRKRIEVPGRVIKSVGNYKVSIRLYEKDEATLKVVVKGHVEKAREPAKVEAPRRHRRDEHAGVHANDAPQAQAAAQASVEPAAAVAPEASSESAQD
ncbi:MAG TPA: 50S ribosomal protein L9 [Spirochaetaceae bacterium]|nr:50S ribosomal protein L9 [Spirochaetaceae bacterium]